jgi:CBS domain-containing protein
MNQSGHSAGHVYGGPSEGWREVHSVGHVLDLKGRDVFTIVPDATIDEAVIEMCRHKVGALLVIDDKKTPVGMLSERDLLIRVLLSHRNPALTRVAQVMTRHVVCVAEQDSIESAMAMMTHARCRHLPVMGDGIVGMISIGDLVRAVSCDHEYELRALHEYIEGRYPC